MIPKCKSQVQRGAGEQPGWGGSPAPEPGRAQGQGGPGAQESHQGRDLNPGSLLVRVLQRVKTPITQKVSTNLLWPPFFKII